MFKTRCRGFQTASSLETHQLKRGGFARRLNSWISLEVRDRLDSQNLLLRSTFQWVDGELNWFSCDVFGKIISLGKISDFDQIQIVDSKEFIFLKEKNLFLLDTNKNMIYTIENVEKSFTNFFYKDQILSIFTNQEIINYKIPKP